MGQMSDLHLGYRQYGKYDRIKDFYNAAISAAELLVEQDPDLILVPGDIFHRPRPYPVDQRQAIKVFNVFKEKEIPVFAIRGNHDASYAWSKRQGGNEIHVFQDLGLVNLLEDKYEEVNLTDGRSVRVWGVGYYGAEPQKRLGELVEENKQLLEPGDTPNILLLHEFLENMLSSAQLSEYSLDILGFDYIALGHYHGWWVNGSQTMCCTGSTEHVSAEEWDTPKRSAALVVLTRTANKWKPEINRLEYEVRPKKRKILELGTVTISEASDAVADALQELDEEDAIIRVDVRGVLSDTQQTLDINKLARETEKAFYVNIVPEMEYAGPPIRESASDAEVMQEVFVHRLGVPEENANEWVSLAKDMKEILTQSMDDKAEATLLDRLYEFVEGRSNFPVLGGEEH